MVSTPFGTLRFLYVGSSDVKRDLEYYEKVLGSRKVWDHTAFGTRVAAVEVCDGPPLLLAGHRPAPSVLPIFQVENLKVSEKELRSRGWKAEGQLAIFQDMRPGTLREGGQRPEPFKE